MVNPPEIKNPISKSKNPESKINSTESLPPPDLNRELREMYNNYLTLKKEYEEKSSGPEDTFYIKLKMKAIEEALKEKIETADKQNYPVEGTSNSIVIKNKSHKFNKINFVYFLVNENKDQLTDEYGYMHLLGDYFLVATVTDKAAHKYGLSFLIDKNSGRALNDEGYEEIKLMGHDKIIAKKGQKWYWICSNKQQYKMPLGSEMTSGHIQIIQDKDGYLWGYEHDLAKEKLLIPQSVKIDNQSPIFTPPKNDKMAA